MSLHKDLDGWGTSAMKKKMQNKILTGRPFGGTGYVWNKCLSNSIKTRCEYIHDRVTVLEINSNIGSLLLINCYMPFYDINNIDSQTDTFIDVLSFIDSVIQDNPGSKIILLGDMNCNIYLNNNRFSTALNSFLSDKNLMCTYDFNNSFDSNSAYSRCDLVRKSFSLLDYVFVSCDLFPYIENVEIMNHPLNLSDHLPISVSFTFDIESFTYASNPLPSIVDWKKVEGDIRLNYVKTMEQCLDNVVVPDILHGSHLCSDTNHIGDVERYYNEIINCIKTADHQLPRFTPTVRKCYWDQTLSELKNDSIVSHDFWKLHGCPKSGPIFEAKKNSHYKYKLYLRNCKSNRNQNHVDALNTDLANGDNNKFWRSYKYYNSNSKRGDVYINGLRSNESIANCFADSFESIYDSNDEYQSRKLKNEFDGKYSDYFNTHNTDSLLPHYLTRCETVNVLSNLET